MPYGVSDEQLDSFLKHPRDMTFALQDTDIVTGGRVELLELFKPDHLKSGFQMDPPLNIYDEDLEDAVRAKGTKWDLVILETYRRDGQITYRELQDGVYEAVVSLPPESEWPVKS